ncbi:DUF397 domain-containing protein [Streptomyces sp. bgisy100]|uniref:DUF397 domain-containing protein n=1 Tax=Streptomyces sp. bgisy100 TaxID=3413783 RepID=UPI003D71F0C0
MVQVVLQRGSGTECVEAAFASDSTLVRDSKDPNGPVLAFSATAWEHFVSALRHGDIGS